MELLGVAATVPDPAGGRIVRDETGQPTGVLIDNAAGLFASRIPPPSNEVLRRWIGEGAEHALARGLTTVTEMGVGPGEVAVYRELASAGDNVFRASQRLVVPARAFCS